MWKLLLGARQNWPYPRAPFGRFLQQSQEALACRLLVAQGLSTELGAFVAGVMLSTTDQQEHALHQLEQVVKAACCWCCRVCRPTDAADFTKGNDDVMPVHACMTLESDAEPVARRSRHFS